MLNGIALNCVRAIRFTRSGYFLPSRNYESAAEALFEHDVILSCEQSKRHPINETAKGALERSCYQNKNWRICEHDTVENAVNRMVAHNFGALAVTSSLLSSSVSHLCSTLHGARNNPPKVAVVGIFTERDYIQKLALSDWKTIKVGDVCTRKKHESFDLISVQLSEPIEKCYQKLLEHNVRHLLVVKDKISQVVVGLCSVKDVVKCAHVRNKLIQSHLEDHIILANIVNIQSSCHPRA